MISGVLLFINQHKSKSKKTLYILTSVKIIGLAPILASGHCLNQWWHIAPTNVYVTAEMSN